MAREAHVDRGLELDDPRAQRVRHLVREHPRCGGGRASPDEAVRAGLASRGDRLEEVPVRERVRPARAPPRRARRSPRSPRPASPTRRGSSEGERREPRRRLGLDDRAPCVPIDGASLPIAQPHSRSFLEINHFSPHDDSPRASTPEAMRRSLGPLLCELHAHTRWSDGELTVAELVDLHGAAASTSSASPTTSSARTIPGARRRACASARSTRRTFPLYLAEVEREAARAANLRDARRPRTRAHLQRRRARAGRARGRGRAPSSSPSTTGSPRP